MARPRAFDETVALQKALDTFWQRGYGATSMEDLVAGMGLNRASLYATFGDKHQLFLRVLRHYQQQAYQNLTALTADPAVPALDHVRRILDLTAGLCFADAQRKGCLMVNATTELLPHDAEVLAVAAHYQQFLETLLTALLRQGQERGEVRTTASPRAQARLLLSVLNGLRVLAKANPDPQLVQDVVETVLLTLA